MISLFGNQDHIPVLISPILEKIKPISGVWIDGTFGAGGYAKAFLESGADVVIGIDRDPEAHEYADALRSLYPEKLYFINENFSNLENVAKGLGFRGVNGVVLDLGVSSMQINSTKRGFSFRYDSPLDMRMSKTGKTAAEVVNELSESRLSDIFFKFGEEKKSKAVAREIVRVRKAKPLSSTFDLINIIKRVIKDTRASNIHPATRCFQALRIYVNAELEEIEKALFAAKSILFNGGFLVVVSFHSLEDRIVKNFLKNSSQLKPRPNRYLPISDFEHTPFEIITKKPIVPTDYELSDNPRSRSAKCRIAVKTGNNNFQTNKMDLL